MSDSQARQIINLSNLMESAEIAPMIEGIKFNSKPEALRHVILANEIISNFPQGAVGLDIGSKSNLLSRLLWERGYKIFRMDILTAGRDVDKTFTVANGEQLPYQANKFDFVVMSHILSHVPNIESLMGECFRVLKSSGKCIILQSNKFGWWRYWNSIIKKNDIAYHLRALDYWDFYYLAIRHSFVINYLKSPYYFYLASKKSNTLFKFDVIYGPKIPKLFATHFLIILSKNNDLKSYLYSRKIPLKLMYSVGFINSVFVQAVTKITELTAKLFSPGK